MNRRHRPLALQLKVHLKMIKSYKKYFKNQWMKNTNWCWKNFSLIMFPWSQMVIHRMLIMTQLKSRKMLILRLLKCKKLLRTSQQSLMRLFLWSLPTLFLYAVTPIELMLCELSYLDLKLPHTQTVHSSMISSSKMTILIIPRLLIWLPLEVETSDLIQIFMPRAKFVYLHLVLGAEPQREKIGIPQYHL